jgi:ribosome-associated protein
MSTTEPTAQPQSDLEDVLRVIAEAADEKHADQLRVLDVRGVVSYTDAIVLASGGTDRQVAAIVDEIESRVRKDLGLKPGSVEGRMGATWVCMDYGDVIVHVFYGPARSYYEVDNLWPDSTERASELLAATA